MSNPQHEQNSKDYIDPTVFKIVFKRNLGRDLEFSSFAKLVNLNQIDINHIYSIFNNGILYVIDCVFN